jgi:hypothetical protein
VLCVVCWRTTGDYQLSVSSDDASELWISSDASAANLTKIVDWDYWNTVYQFVDGDARRYATPLPLEKGA